MILAIDNQKGSRFACPPWAATSLQLAVWPWIRPMHGGEALRGIRVVVRANARNATHCQMNRGLCCPGRQLLVHADVDGWLASSSRQVKQARIPSRSIRLTTSTHIRGQKVAAPAAAVRHCRREGSKSPLSQRLYSTSICQTCMHASTHNRLPSQYHNIQPLFYAGVKCTLAGQPDRGHPSLNRHWPAELVPSSGEAQGEVVQHGGFGPQPPGL
jgi:hypothetical protein